MNCVSTRVKKILCRMSSTSSKSPCAADGSYCVTDSSIQMHTIVIQLLNPLAQSDTCEGHQLQEILSIIRAQARQGLNLIKQATKLYTARFHMPMISLCCVHLADAMVVYEPKNAPGALHISMSALQEAHSGFHLCVTLQDLLRQRALAHNIELAEGTRSMLGSRPHIGMDEILDACTRMTYTQPLKEVLCRFKSTPQEDPPQPTSAHERMQIDAVLNDDEN